MSTKRDGTNMMILMMHNARWRCSKRCSNNCSVTSSSARCVCTILDDHHRLATMSSRRIYRRTQIGDSNASSDSSICDKSKNFRCLLQGVVKKDQSASGLHTAVLDLQQRRINTVRSHLHLCRIPFAAVFKLILF